MVEIKNRREFGGECTELRWECARNVIFEEGDVRSGCFVASAVGGMGSAALARQASAAVVLSGGAGDAGRAAVRR
jgi:hypothetical protein